MATRKSLNLDPRLTGVDPLAADPVIKTTAVPTESKQTAEQVAAVNKEDTVLVNVEKPFKLTDDSHVVHSYVAGANKMPRSHTQHWYAKAHGITIVS